MRIIPGNLRWKVAQAWLKLLYGRNGGRDFDISPWKHGGQVAAGILIYNRKVVLGKRAGNIERAGYWGLVGGFVDLDKDELFHETLAREIWEETGIKISAESFDPNRPFYVIQKFHTPMNALADECHVCAYFLYELSDEERAQIRPTEEASEYANFSFDEVKELIAAGQFSHEENFAPIEETKRLGLID